MERNELFKDYITTHFGANIDMSDSRLVKEFDQFEKNIKRYLSRGKNVEILEVGFGTGYLIKYLLDNEYSAIKGIEISPEITQFVKKNVYKNVECIKDTNKYLQKNRNAFDYIFMFDVLEHIPKKEVIELLKDLKGSLKNGGKLFIRVPNAANPFNQSLYADFTHECFFNTYSLKQVLKIVEFSDLQVGSWLEESVSIKSKLTNLTAPFMYFLFRLFGGLSRSSIYFDIPLNRNIYAVVQK